MNAAKLLELTNSHWKALVIVGLIVGAYYAGKFRAAAPAVHEQLTDTSKADAKGKVDSTTQAGPEDITIRDFGWAPPVLPPGFEKAEAAPAPAAADTSFCRPIVTPGEDRVVTREIVIHRGPSTTTTHAENEQHLEQEQKLDLVLNPSTPHYSLLFGYQVLPDKRLAFGGAVRLPELPIIGAWWVQAEIAPDLAEFGKTDIRGFLRKDF